MMPKFRNLSQELILKLKNMNNLIGFIGFKGSGKTEASKTLIELGFKQVNFKDGLVKEIKDNFRLLLKEISFETGIDEINLFQEKPMLMRRLLQEYGTEVRRGDDENYWIDKWKNNLSDDNIVTDDCRFINEYKALKENGGIVIKIVRDGCNGDNHKSETEIALLDFDYKVENNGTLEELQEEILKIIGG